MAESESNKNDYTCLLVIVFDTNPNQNYIRRDPQLLTKSLNAIIAFGNSHLMLKQSNKLAVLSCHHHKSEFLYPNVRPLDVRQIDGQYEYFTLIEKTIKSNLANLIKNAPKQSLQSESLLAGSLAMVLCYIARVSSSFSIKRKKGYIAIPNIIFSDQKNSSARSEATLPNFSRNWKCRCDTSIHELYECLFYRSERKNCS